MEGYQLTLCQIQIGLRPKVCPCTTSSCTAKTDAGSDGVEPASGFVIKNHQTMYSISCPMQTVGHTVRAWSAICLMAPHSQSGKGARNLIVHERMKSPNTSLQAIDLNPSCSKQAYFNRLGVGHEYESTEPGCILTVFRILVICPLVTLDWRAVFSCSSRPEIGQQFTLFWPSISSSPVTSAV